jgi:protein phosphatase
MSDAAGHDPPPSAAGPWLDVAVLSDVGTERPHNEDFCGFVRAGASSVLAAVADGVSSFEGGEVASQKAVEVTLSVYRGQPATVPVPKRLARAVQQANIEVYDLATVVPELRGMATTLTAVALDGTELWAAHIGDSRLYLLRGGRLTQLTKDHTVAAERRRMGLISAARAQSHPDRGTLTKCLGRELIVGADRLSTRVGPGDVLVLCTDGLHNALDSDEISRLAATEDAASACRALIEAANARGTADNLSAAVVRIVGTAEQAAARRGVGGRLMRLLGRGK